MRDFTRLRDVMVDKQLILRGIKDKRVLDAMRKVPRHLFIPESSWDDAYEDMALPIGEGQTISQPYMVAIMTELLELTGNEKVLEVGTGSGYQAAILGELAKEVYTIERIEKLAFEAERRLLELGYKNIYVFIGDGSKGLPEKSPFDRIIVTAASPEIPKCLKEQLGDSGIIVVPVGQRFSQMLVKGKKIKGVIKEEFHTPCIFVPLIGEYGWKE